MPLNYYSNVTYNTNKKNTNIEKKYIVAQASLIYDNLIEKNIY